MKAYWTQDNNKIYQGHVLNVLKEMASESVQCCITSPPYWGLRDYNLPSQIWDAKENCEHKWISYEPGFESFSFKRKAIIVDKLCKGDTISNVEINTIASCLGIDLGKQANLLQNNSKSDEKFLTTTTKIDSTPFIDTTVTIKNTPDKIRHKVVGNKGEFTNKTFSGLDTKFNQSIPEINRPEGKPPDRIASTGCFGTDGFSGGNLESDEINQRKIIRNKTDVSGISDTSVCDEKPKDIGKISRPNIEKDKINGMFSRKKLSPTTQITETLGMSPELPSGSINTVATKNTKDISACSSAGSRKLSPIHKTIICQNCGAVKCSLGLEPTPELFIQHMVQIFSEIKRVLRKDGTLWLNIGDSYWGGKGQNNYRWSAENTERETLTKPQHNVCSNRGEKRPQDGTHDTIKPKDLVGIP